MKIKKKMCKGSTLDMFFLMIMLVVMAIFFIIGAYIKDQINPTLKTLLNDSSATNVINTVESSFNSLDFIFLFIFVLFGGLPILLAFFSQEHPIFMIFNFIIMAVMVVLSPVMSNIIHEFWTQTQFSEYSAGGSGSVTFPIMTYAMQYLPIIMSGFGFLLSIVLYAKR